LKGTVIPADVQVSVTRNYGETAREKNNELLFHMFLAAISVTILIAIFMGWRAGAVAAIAIPVTLALTMLIFYLIGYALNRITSLRLFSPSAFWWMTPLLLLKIFIVISPLRA
jgi:multidrug efflux pump subunit AcrB